MRIRRSRLTATLVAVFLFMLLGVSAGMATEATESEEAPADDAAGELLRRGQAVYEANCVACHQGDGKGIPDAFPPLVDNPNVQDTEYVMTVIRNGLTGEIEVNGETYNGAMPAFTLLDDGQVDAVIAYVQNNLVAPPAPGGEATGAVAGTALPTITVVMYGVGFLLFLVVAALVAAPYVLAKNPYHEFDWPRAWLKAIVIFLFFTIATVVLPSLAIQSDPLSSAARALQDLVASGIWLAALVLGLWGLRKTQRERII